MSGSNAYTFRNIELHDQDDLLKLRNSPSNLEFFKNPSPITSEDHAEWFASRIMYFKEHQIIAILSNKLIGIVYLVPIDDHSSSISINIDFEYQSQGIGRELLMRMLTRAHLLNYTRIEALIHISNKKSITLFKKCGFVFKEEVSEFFVRYVKFSNQNIER